MRKRFAGGQFLFLVSQVRVLVIAGLALLASANVLTAEPVVASSATAFSYDQNNRDLQIVDDKDCKSGKALELRFHGRAVLNAALPVMASPPAGPLTPGLYRATIRLKMQGMLRSLGTGIIIGINEFNTASKKAGAVYTSRTLYLNEFTAEDAWQEFSIDFDVHPGLLARTRLDEAAADAFLKADRRVAQLPAERYAALRQWILANPMQSLPEKNAPGKIEPQLIAQLNATGATPPVIALTLSIAQNKPGIGGSRGNSSPFPSLRRLYADSVTIQALPDPAVVVRDVRAQKAWLRPGEKQSFTVDLHNRSGAPRNGQIRISIEAGLGATTALPPASFDLKNGEYSSVQVEWNVPATHRIWGQTAIASAEVDGKPVSSWRTWFTVHPRNIPVMIPWSDTYAAKESCNFQHPTASKPNVANLYEAWAPTPYDAAGLVPEDLKQPFMAGNSGKVESLVKQAEKVGKLKDAGIASVFYCEAHGTGLKAWDTYWNHPDWCAPSEPTSDLFYIKRRDAWPQVKLWYLQQEASNKKNRGETLNDEEQAALKQPQVQRMPDIVHVGFVTLNGLAKPVVDTIIQGHITLMDAVPYIGCRWDTGKPLDCFNTDALGHNLGKTPADLERQTLENLERYFKEIRAKHPELEIGLNGGHGELMGKRDDPFDFEAAKKVIDSDPVVKKILSDGGYILEEAWGHAFEVWNDYKIVARNYLRACRAESAAYKYAGGQHGHMFRDNGVEYTPDDIYQQIFSLLGGAHLCTVNYGPLPESTYDLGVYAARFGEFFWDPKLRQLTKMDEKVRVETDTDIWATEAGFEKDTDEGTRLYVLPLINPPAIERWLKNRYGLLPEPVRRPIAVTVAVPEGYKGVKAVYHLENRPWPEVKILKFETDGKEVRFEIPELVTFKVAVVEFTR